MQALQGNAPSVVEFLLLLDGAEAPNGLHDSTVQIINVSSNVMKKLSGVQSIDSITAIAIMKIPSSFYQIYYNQGLETCENWLSCADRILILDGIQDPGNLGTLLRSAMAFKWDGVFLLPGCCDPFNEKALRAARGATFQLPIVSGTCAHLEELRSKFQMKMLAGHPKNVEESNCHLLSRQYADTLADKSVCLILGSEGNGLSEQSKNICELVSIPMAENFESLNVSVAGGIFLFMLQPELQKEILS
ncbi:uncharacterized protein [Aristolochia californica]